MPVRPPPVVLKPTGRHTATLIFLHGLGDTGHGWAAAMNSIRPDFLKVVCPTAPTIPVTLNMGMRMPAWYDIYRLDDSIHRFVDPSTDPVSNKREDTKGLQESSDYLDQLIHEEGPDIPRNRIMIGGFSQGGAVAISTLTKNTENSSLAGCIALSTWFPGAGTKATISKPPKKLDTPVLQCHGESDEMISFEIGQLTANVLKGLVKEHTFMKFPYMGHECNDDELMCIKDFVNKKIQ